MTTEQLLDPALPRLHHVTTAAEGIDYLLKHVSWCIDHPHHAHPNDQPSPVTTLHRLVCCLIEFANNDWARKDSTRKPEQTFYDMLNDEHSIFAAIELVDFRERYLLWGKRVNLPNQIVEGNGWWQRLYRFMHRLNEMYLPISKRRLLNHELYDYTSYPFGMPDPPLGDDLRNEFLQIFREAMTIKLEKGPSMLPMMHDSNPRFAAERIRLCIFNVHMVFHLSSMQLDEQQRDREKVSEYRAATEQHLRSIRSTSTTP